MPATFGVGTFYPRRVNSHVPNLVCDANVDIDGSTRVEYGPLPALSANGIMNAIDIAAIITKGGTINPLFKPDRDMGKFGRNVTLALSGAGTPTVTVRGRDYLGQPVAENLVAAGATTVQGKKAFKTVDNITTSAGVAATTLSLGWGNVLGLPYAMVKIDTELVDNVIAAAGTFVPYFAGAGSLTSADPRGTYTPAAGVVPNGAREIHLLGTALSGNLNGPVHFYS